MTEAIDKPNGKSGLDLLANWDLNALKTDEMKSQFLTGLCNAMGLEPWLRPFDILNLQGKTVVYANKGAAAQLRQKLGINVEVVYAGPLMLGKIENPDIYSVQVKATDKENRISMNIGTVSIKGMAGEPLANAIMKCYTKAIRRTTLEHAGCGFPDESEVKGDYTDAVPEVRLITPKAQS